jgi:hypothetical protein
MRKTLVATQLYFYSALKLCILLKKSVKFTIWLMALFMMNFLM